jgi:hypothetical protein
MIDPLLTSLFLLLLDERWLLRSVEFDTQQNRRWPIPNSLLHHLESTTMHESSKLTRQHNE